MKHSPQIKFSAALRAMDLARENCPHWDHEGHDHSGSDCCYELESAIRAYKAAKVFLGQAAR